MSWKVKDVASLLTIGFYGERLKANGERKKLIECEQCQILIFDYRINLLGMQGIGCRMQGTGCRGALHYFLIGSSISNDA
jgi:hypothetical protein